MNSAHHPGEIDYYTELGVEPNASPEEIREAYRALVRMLHPDQQLDEQLKLIAERQLRKINSVYSVLSDPAQRRIYDEDLAEGLGSPIIVHAPPAEGMRRFARRVVWGVAILMGAGLLWWLASGNVSAPPSHVHEPITLSDTASPDGNPKYGAAKSADADRAPTIQRLQADLRVVASQRDAAQGELDQLRASMTRSSTRRNFQPPPFQPPPTAPEHAGTTLAGAAPLPTPPGLPPTAPAVATKLALPAAPAPAPRFDPPKKRLAGFWFYVRPENSQAGKGRGDYSPEFIEATITEDNGVIHGDYRSRFRIVDRPISPDVNFTFTGSPNGVVLKCPWTGPGGAKGELTLQLVSENSIRLEWLAVNLGTQQGLISGTAVLTRKVD